MNARLATHAVEARRERAIYAFAFFEMFSNIYLQKIAFGTQTFQVRLPLILMALGIAWMLVSRTAGLSGLRVGLYFSLVGCTLTSWLFTGLQGSLPSLALLLVMYFFLTVSFKADKPLFLRVMRLYIMLLTVPAGIVYIQYWYQHLTGLADPINMNTLLPKEVLLQGYFYNAHYPFFYSKFTRPNGFFFLEPSFASEYMALAAIIEAAYFRRIWVVAFYVAATIFSTGATGVVTLSVAAPFLLARESPRTVVTVLVLGAAAMAVGIATDQLPFLSRLGEFNSQQSSGSDRMLVPAYALMELLADPSFLLTGNGPGAPMAGLGSAWPIVKMVNEYGICSAIAYLALFFAVLGANRENIPLKAAICFVFHLTGGYLFDLNAIDMLVVSALYSFPAGPLSPSANELLSHASSGSRQVGEHALAHR